MISVPSSITGTGRGACDPDFPLCVSPLDADLRCVAVALKHAQIKTFDTSPQLPFRRHTGNPGQSASDALSSRAQ